MTVSKTHIKPHSRIAQLEQEIADKEAERNRIRLEAIVELRANQHSLSTIGKEVGLTRGRVHQLIAIYEAGNGPIKAGNK